MIAKRSPPIPLTKGCVRPVIAFAAIAASIAFPPFSRILAPASDARKLEAATIPYLLTMSGRAESYGGGGGGVVLAVGCPLPELALGDGSSGCWATTKLTSVRKTSAMRDI